VSTKEHWERVYSTKATDSVSWFQEHADCSLRLIEGTGVSSTAAIIDIGGGASTLVDDLLAKGFSNLTVLDLSAAALYAARSRLGAHAKKVKWIEGDITRARLEHAAFDLWHDRAVFHFLTSAEERIAYLDNVMRAVKPGGHVVVATFAEDGPTRCSGLPVMRYSAADLHAAFGKSFTLVRHEKEAHRTPFGTLQQFTYCHLRR
jgi:ubiquinone/menaquinone biosynthesis C-methylase UbiE